MSLEGCLFTVVLLAAMLCLTGCFEQPGEIRSMPTNVWKFQDGDVTCYVQDNSVQACVYVPPGEPKSCHVRLDK